MTSKFFLNQVELLIWTYKNKGYRNNQMVLQVAQPTDMLLQDPPCLRHIDTRIQDGKLHFFPYFRSWSLWGGLPANLAAIELMKQYVAAEIGVENGEIIASSKGLHLYDYEFDLGKMISMKQDIDFQTRSSNPY
jgi:thymidylate synthase